MTEKCDVDGCENDADTICETKDDNGGIMSEEILCREHIEQLVFGEKQ